MKLKIIILVLFLLFPSVLWSACVSDGDDWVSTPDYASVASCISQADYGDTITVSAGDGTETWSSGVTINKNIHIIGPGMDNLTILQNTSSTLINYLQDATAKTNEDSNEFFRFSGFTIDSNNVGQAFTIRREGTSWKNPNYPVGKFRIDNVRIIDGGGSYGIHIDNGSRGVFDNCIFVNGIKTARLEGRYWFGRDVEGETFVPADSASSTANGIYFEDCTFSNTETEANIISSQDGHPGWVIRFSTINITSYIDSTFDIHGSNNAVVDYSICPPEAYRPGCDEVIPDEDDDCCSGGRSVGSVEFYNNEITGSGSVDKFLDQRGEIAIVFGNEFASGFGVGNDGYADKFFQIRSRSSSSWCRTNGCDQVNNSYYFDNTQNSVPLSDPYAYEYWNAQPDYGYDLYPDVDFWTYVALGSFDGTTGVTQGTNAQMLSTQSGDGCTEGVGFHVTDLGTWNTEGADGQLWVCNGSNTYVLFYEPYTYPHPLRDEVASTIIKKIMNYFRRLRG